MMESSSLKSLFDTTAERRPQSVSELNSEIRTILETGFSSVWVEGEITNFHSAASGHWYFSLTDGDSLIKAACFKGRNFRIRFKPTNGLHVRCRGSITTYEKRGEYQLLVDSLEPVGEGALTLAFEQVKARLLAEGLFDQALKRPLPPYPKRVGIVTSPTGAAVHDILTVMDRRARSVNIVLIPTLVQGEQAPEQIAAAIGLANEYNAKGADGEPLDVLIVGRGGGSAEDLWAFNDEQVARAIRASAIPVISAVGHEVDFTIADMAADLRAATPSAAAEIVAESEKELLNRALQLEDEIRKMIQFRLFTADAALRSAELARVFAEFPARLKDVRYRLDDLANRAGSGARTYLGRISERIGSSTSRLSPVYVTSAVADGRRQLDHQVHRAGAAVADHIVRKQEQLQRTVSKLDALSPLSVLTRGYSITQKMSGEIIRSAHQTNVGDIVKIQLARGRLEASVVKISDE